MRVLLSAYGSRGDVEPLAALAVRLRALDADVRMCAPGDEEFAALLDGTGVPLVPLGRPVRPPATGATPPAAGTGPTATPPAKSLSQRAADLIAELFDTLAPAADGCDAVVSTGVFPAMAAARALTDKLGIHYVYTCFQPTTLPSPHHPPHPLPGRPHPPSVTDNRELWDLDAQGYNALFAEALNTQRASIGLPPVDDVRAHVLTEHPWLAADPVLGPWPKPADLGVVQTGAWMVPDERPLPADLEAFLDAGAPPVYVGFGSMPMPALQDVARMAIEGSRALGRRVLVSRGWADLVLIDDGDDCFAVGEVNQQALFGRVAAVVHHGGAGTTTIAARAGAPQVVVPQVVDQPYWARRVAELGIGAAHDGPSPTAESLSSALRTALDPETRARARDVAGTVRTDGATVAAKLLLDAISR